VEGPALELAEILKEYGNKRCNIYGSVFGGALEVHVRQII
jgi:hypothetical protein